MDAEHEVVAESRGLGVHSAGGIHYTWNYLGNLGSHI